MAEIMSPTEFKHGLLRLAEDGPALVNERVIARHLAAAYIDADDAAKADCSEMLRADLAALSREDHAG